MILKFSLETDIPPPCPIALLGPTIGFGHPAEARTLATTVETGRKLGAVTGRETHYAFTPPIETRIAVSR
jgi:hypothetical protein